MSTDNTTQDLVSKIPANVVDNAWIDLKDRSYAGYATANFKDKTAQLFYWFSRAENSVRRRYQKIK